MNTDDTILATLIAADKPLASLATSLGMTLIALVQWMDRNADLLGMAKRAMETHVGFLTLHAEAAAIADLSAVSASTPNEERKRKSSSQLLRHVAKRLLTPSRRSRLQDAPGALDIESPSRLESAPAKSRQSTRVCASVPREDDLAPAPTLSSTITSRAGSLAPPKVPSSTDP